MATTSNRFKMSQERLDALKEELYYLETTREKEVAELIKEARSFGDLSENSEYDEAKTEQGKLYSKIAELKVLIENAEIVDNIETDVPKDAVTLGSIVCVRDVEDGFEETFEIVDPSVDFVMAIETGGMFARLIENNFPEKYNCALIHLSGQPTRSTRRLIKRLNEEYRIPVTVFTDGDPWSFRIFASVAYGAIKTAHISDYLATPTAQFIGITASDILNYDLPTDKLSDKDIGALNAELSDPRFKDEFWVNEIQAMLDMKKKAEQQALAKYGLNYVTDKYLPEKLTDMGVLR